MIQNDASLATIGQIIWRLIEHNKLDAAALFQQVGIDPRIIRSPHERIPHASLMALVRALAAQVSDPAFGLRAALCWHPSNLGTLGYAWLSSASLRTALERLVRYWRTLVPQVAVSLAESSNSVAFVHRPPAVDEVIDRYRGDASMAILLDMCRRNHGDRLNPLHVAFQHRAPADRRPYESYFRCPVTFGEEANRLILASMDADHPLMTSNRQLAAMHDKILADELARLDKKDVAARARASLLERLTSGALSEEKLARDLHMSRRSLQRRLEEAETTYQALLDDTRRDLALRYLEDPAKSATDVTFLLGYSQQSAFTRAFRRWTGMSPTEYRARQAPAPARSVNP